MRPANDLAAYLENWVLRRENILIAVDISGSMMNGTDHAKFIKTAYEMFCTPQRAADVLYFDHKLHPIKSLRDSSCYIDPNIGRGGSGCDKLFAFLDLYPSIYDGIIILSDLMFPVLAKPTWMEDNTLLWAIIEEPQDHPITPSWGEVLRLSPGMDIITNAVR